MNKNQEKILLLFSHIKSYTGLTKLNHSVARCVELNLLNYEVVRSVPSVLECINLSLDVKSLVDQGYLEKYLKKGVITYSVSLLGQYKSFDLSNRLSDQNKTNIDKMESVFLENENKSVDELIETANKKHNIHSYSIGQRIL